MSHDASRTAHSVPAAGSLDEESLDEARRQLAFLEDGLGALGESAESAALMDEVYRAAHSLKAEINAAEMPEVARIARLVQEVVRATRAGQMTASPEIGTMIAAAARSALESMDAHAFGKAAPATAVSSAVALESLIADQPRLKIETEGRKGTAALTRVEAGRIGAAVAALAETGAAAASLAQASEEGATLAASLRVMADRQERNARDLVDVLPRYLAMAAKGESTTGIARDLAERITALGAIPADFEGLLGRFTSLVREAASSGARAAVVAGSAVSRIGSLRLASVLEGFPRRMRSISRMWRFPVDVSVDAGEVEIDASLADVITAAITRCARTSLEPAPGKSRKPGKRKKGQRERLTLDAGIDGGSVKIRLVHKGDTPSQPILLQALAATRTRLERKGVILSMNCRRGTRAVFALKLPEWAASEAGSYLLARSGDTRYAIPVASITECISVEPAMTEFPLGGRKLPVLRMGNGADASAGVIVHDVEETAVLLFDELDGEESLVPTPIEHTDGRVAGIGSSAARADGTVALVLDVPEYLSARRAEGRGGGRRKRSLKR